MSYRINPDHQPTSSFEPVPPGDYSVIVVDADWRTSKSGSRYVNVRLDITGPTHAGRVVWWRCNLENASEKAAAIANDQMHAFCLSAGIEGWDHPADLVGRAAVAKLKIGRTQEGYSPQNEVSTFIFSPRANGSGAPGGAAPVTPAPAKKRGWV